MIKHFTDDRTLTTIKDGAPIVDLLVGLFVKISVNTGIVVSGRVKRGSGQDVQSTVKAMKVATLMDKLFLVMLNVDITQPVLALVGAPTSILSLTIACLHVFFLNVPFFVVFSFNSTVLQDVNSAHQPLCVLVITNVIGAVLGLVFIVIFRVDITNITVTASVTGTIDTTLVVCLLVRRGRPFQLGVGEVHMG